MHGIERVGGARQSLCAQVDNPLPFTTAVCVGGQWCKDAEKGEKSDSGHLGGRKESHS